MKTSISFLIIGVLMVSGCTRETTKAKIGGTTPTIQTGTTSNSGLASTADIGSDDGSTFPGTRSGSAAGSLFPRTNRNTSYPNTVPTTTAPASSGIGNWPKTLLLVGGGLLAAVLVYKGIKGIFNKVKEMGEIAQVNRYEKMINASYKPGLLDWINARKEERIRKNAINELAKALKSSDDDKDGKKSKKEERSAKTAEEEEKEKNKRKSVLASAREKLRNFGDRIDLFGRHDDTDPARKKEKKKTDEATPPADTCPEDDQHNATDINRIIKEIEEASPAGMAVEQDSLGDDEETLLKAAEKAKKKENGEQKEDLAGTDDKKKKEPTTRKKEEETAKEKKKGNDGLTEEERLTDADGNKEKQTKSDKNDTVAKESNPGPTATVRESDKLAKTGSDGHQNPDGLTRDLSSPYLFNNGELNHAHFARRTQAHVIAGLMQNRDNQAIKQQIERDMSRSVNDVLYNRSGRTTDYNWNYSDSTLSRTRARLNEIGRQTYDSSSGTGWVTNARLLPNGDRGRIAVQYLLDNNRVVAQRQVEDLNGQYRVKILDTRNTPVGSSFVMTEKPEGLTYQVRKNGINLEFPTN